MDYNSPKEHDYMFLFTSDAARDAENIKNLSIEEGLKIQMLNLKEPNPPGRGIVGPTSENFLKSDRIVIFLSPEMLSNLLQWTKHYIDPHAQTLSKSGTGL